ncbi:hypothetical protein ACFWNU_34120, partial [Streptomyces sp. NPDC058427]|uniref:hypothetical protein n=1 Tax=Streptomyces sp. NPDC058427 TaxID=3346494 RepID=UPI00365C14B5
RPGRVTRPAWSDSWRNPVKPLLWIVLIASIVANVSLSFLVEQGGLNIALSAVSGVVVLSSAAGLWTLRRPREY